MRSLLKFFVITYALAWTGFIVPGTLSDTGTPAAVRQLLFLPAAFAPAVVAR